MDKKKLRINQYAFDTKNLDENNKEYLENIAPKIGYIVQNFNALEQLLDLKICELLNSRSDVMGLIIIQKLNYSAKVDLFERLLMDIQYCFEKNISILKTLINDLKYSGKLRNTVVHSDWESSHIDGYTVNKFIINKNGPQYEYTQFTEESLEKILDLIIGTYNLFDVYDQEYSDLYISK
jgi:hypothetical protein